MFIFTDRLYEHSSKLKSSFFCCCVKARRLYLMNASSNNLFLVIGVTKLASRVVKKAKKGQRVRDRVPDRDKADELAAEDVPPTIRDEGLSSAIGKKRPSPETVDAKPIPSVTRDKRPLIEIADAEPTPPAIGDKRLLPEIADIELIPPAIGDKEPLPKSADPESILPVGDKGLVPAIDGVPTLADGLSTRANDRPLPKTVDERLPATAVDGAPTLAQKVAYARVIFFC